MPIAISTTRLFFESRFPPLTGAARSFGAPPTVLLGVDRLDYTKGIRHRLKAYGELLRERRLGPPSAVLVQVASPSRERVEQYQLLRDEVEGTVGRINGDHSVLGHPAVHYLHTSVPRDELAAFYLAADVMAVTPVRDGMNLVSKEYVACRYDLNGVLVLSEFAGAAAELTGALLVNPHDTDGVKNSLHQALTMETDEVHRRMRSLRRQVMTYDVERWAQTFLSTLSSDNG